MRIAVLILGLVLGVAMFFQTWLVYALSGLSSKPNEIGTSATMGLLMAILWLIGVAAVIGAPLVSVIAFAFAGVIGIAMSANFPDLAVWGAVSFILAVLSLIGWRQKRRDAKREAARHQELVSAVRRVERAAEWSQPEQSTDVEGS